MIYEIGDLITLTTVEITSNDGTATLVVTDPSGVAHTTSGITYSNSAYTATYRATAAGLHTITWTTTNNVVQDSFEVRGALNAIVSLADARNWLRLRATDTTDDDKILALIETATDLIQDVTGPLIATTYTEFFDGNVPQIQVAHPPIASITTVVEYYGLTSYTLTEQQLGSQTSPYSFTADYLTGQLTRRTYGGDASIFAPGVKNVKVTYVGSRLPVPSAIQLAVRELVRHLYSNTQVPSGRARVGPGNDSEGGTSVSYAVPNFVLDMIPLKYRRTPGIY